MNVDLDEALEAYVRALVSSGKYRNVSEVIRDALRIKMRGDKTRAAQLGTLRTDIAKARDQVRSGDIVEVDARSFLDRHRG